MNKNKILALLILFLIIGGIAFWIIWGIILNKGTVVFTFDRPPYTAAVGEEEKICLAAECEFWLPVGPRAYTITKDGYYEKTGSINIVRDKKITENIALEFIPQAAEGTPYVSYLLPAGYSKFSDTLKSVSLFADITVDYSLKNLPKIINNIIFSKTGDKAVVFEDNKVSLYFAKDFTQNPLNDIKDAGAAVFSADETELYAVSYDEAARKYALKKVYLSEEKPAESLVYFGRDVINCELTIADSGSLISLADKTFSPEILYVIDLNAKSRTNIFEGYLIESGSWSENGEVFVFSAKASDENFSSVYYYDAADKSVQKLGVEADIRNISFIDSRAVFISQQKYSITNYSVPYTLQFQAENMPTTYEEITALNDGEKQMVLAKWDLSDGQFYLVKDLSGIISGVPEKIELSPDGRVVRMLIEGLVYDIRIQE